MKPRYNENIELRMTDKSRLVSCIDTEDFYKKDVYMREYLDMSDPIHDETNMKVIGKFEVETGDKVIIGIGSKVYALETKNPITLKLEQKKKLKGISKMNVKKQMTLNGHSECVLENKDKIVKGVLGF